MIVCFFRFQQFGIQMTSNPGCLVCVDRQSTLQLSGRTSSLETTCTPGNKPIIHQTAPDKKTLLTRTQTVLAVYPEQVYSNEKTAEQQ